MSSNSFKFLDKMAPLFYTDKRYFLLYGGRGGGKTYNVAAYAIAKLFSNEYARIIISRFTQKSIKHSIYRDMLDIVRKWGLESFITFEGEEVICKLNDNRLLTHAMRLGDNNQVAKGKGIANPTMLIIDEAQELPSEEEFIKLNDSFRSKDGHTQILVLFNPETKFSWIHQRWFVDGQPNPKHFVDTEYIYLNYLDNKQHLDPKKIQEWERMKDEDPEYYSKHVLGLWQDGVKGRIFSGWGIGFDPDPQSDRTIGLDFGFSNDPVACIDVYKRNNKLHIKELFYKKGMTNPDIAEALLSLGISKSQLIVADSAEPKSIEELRRLGFNVSPAVKGPDSVRAGINKIKEYQVYMDVDSVNLHREYELYRWKDLSGKPLDQDNHLMDALRYALSSKAGDGKYAVMGSSKFKFR